MKKEESNGFLIVIVDKLIYCLYKFNIVEVIKNIFLKFIKNKSVIKKKALANKIIDIFIIFKFVLISSFWRYSINNSFATILVIYLLFMNIFTYFYYHIWNNNIINNFDRMRRRFISLLFALMFSIFGYAYLYAIPLKYAFEWKGSNTNFESLFLSTANTLFMDYQNVVANQVLSNFFVQSQWVSTFIFVTIILASSIPQQLPKK